MISRQRVSGGERSRRAGAVVPLRAVSAIRAGAPACPGRRARRAGAEAGLARGTPELGIRAAGVVGLSVATRDVQDYVAHGAVAAPAASEGSRRASGGGLGGAGHLLREHGRGEVGDRVDRIDLLDAAVTL